MTDDEDPKEKLARLLNSNRLVSNLLSERLFQHRPKQPDDTYPFSESIVETPPELSAATHDFDTETGIPLEERLDPLEGDDDSRRRHSLKKPYRIPQDTGSVLVASEPQQTTPGFDPIDLDTGQQTYRIDPITIEDLVNPELTGIYDSHEDVDAFISQEPGELEPYLRLVNENLHLIINEAPRDIFDRLSELTSPSADDSGDQGGFFSKLRPSTFLVYRVADIIIAKRESTEYSPEDDESNYVTATHTDLEPEVSWAEEMTPKDRLLTLIRQGREPSARQDQEREEPPRAEYAPQPEDKPAKSRSLTRLIADLFVDLGAMCRLNYSSISSPTEAEIQEKKEGGIRKYFSKEYAQDIEARLRKWCKDRGVAYSEGKEKFLKEYGLRALSNKLKAMLPEKETLESFKQKYSLRKIGTELFEKIPGKDKAVKTYKNFSMPSLKNINYESIKKSLPRIGMIAGASIAGAALLYFGLDIWASSPLQDSLQNSQDLLANIKESYNLANTHFSEAKKVLENLTSQNEAANQVYQSAQAAMQSARANPTVDLSQLTGQLTNAESAQGLAKSAMDLAANVKQQSLDKVRELTDLVNQSGVIEKGDNMWKMVKELYSQLSDKPPSNLQVRDLVNDVASSNGYATLDQVANIPDGLKDPNLIYPGDSLNLSKVAESTSSVYQDLHNAESDYTLKEQAYNLAAQKVVQLKAAIEQAKESASGLVDIDALRENLRNAKEAYEKLTAKTDAASSAKSALEKAVSAKEKMYQAARGDLLPHIKNLKSQIINYKPVAALAGILGAALSGFSLYKLKQQAVNT